MREIKFRAWDDAPNDNGKRMFYFERPFFDSEYSWLSFDQPKGLKEYAMHNQSKEDIVLMQYTGLKDKNGKEIYEGDILKSAIEQTVGGQIETIGVVEWDDNGYWKYDLPDYGQSFGINILFDEEYKVIGNIYENPKLLKV